MGDKTGIGWTDATWNPVRGCSRVSAGCENCYAEQVARRFSGKGQPYEGLVRLDADGKPKAQWNGTTRFVEGQLRTPLRWRRPRRIFVNSMSDLFHESVSFPDILRVFAVMGLAPHHTFQVLTKRPERAIKFFEWAMFPTYDAPDVSQADADQSAMSYLDSPSALLRHKLFVQRWPLPNVWIGVSVEDQVSANLRIPQLRAVPAACRFVSYEPAIGPADFDLPRCDVCQQPANTVADDGATPWCSEHERECSYGHWLDPVDKDGSFNGGVNWVIVGGESGTRARPFEIDWAREVVKQCKDAGVAVYVKQLGASVIWDGYMPAGYDHWKRPPTGDEIPGVGWFLRLADRKGETLEEWPPDIRVQEFPFSEDEISEAAS